MSNIPAPMSDEEFNAAMAKLRGTASAPEETSVVPTIEALKARAVQGKLSAMDGDSLKSDNGQGYRLVSPDGLSPYDSYETAKRDFTPLPTDTPEEILKKAAAKQFQDERFARQRKAIDKMNGWEDGTATDETVMQMGKKGQAKLQSALDSGMVLPTGKKDAFGRELATLQEADGNDYATRNNTIDNNARWFDKDNAPTRLRHEADVQRKRDEANARKGTWASDAELDTTSGNLVNKAAQFIGGVFKVGGMAMNAAPTTVEMGLRGQLSDEDKVMASAIIKAKEKGIPLTKAQQEWEQKAVTMDDARQAAEDTLLQTLPDGTRIPRVSNLIPGLAALRMSQGMVSNKAKVAALESANAISEVTGAVKGAANAYGEEWANNRDEAAAMDYYGDKFTQAKEEWKKGDKSKAANTLLKALPGGLIEHTSGSVDTLMKSLPEMAAFVYFGAPTFVAKTMERTDDAVRKFKELHGDREPTQKELTIALGTSLAATTIDKIGAEYAFNGITKKAFLSKLAGVFTPDEKKLIKEAADAAGKTPSALLSELRDVPKSAIGKFISGIMESGTVKSAGILAKGGTAEFMEESSTNLLDQYGGKQDSKKLDYGEAYTAGGMGFGAGAVMAGSINAGKIINAPFKDAGTLLGFKGSTEDAAKPPTTEATPAVDPTVAAQQAAMAAAQKDVEARNAAKTPSENLAEYADPDFRKNNPNVDARHHLYAVESALGLLDNKLQKHLEAGTDEDFVAADEIMVEIEKYTELRGTLQHEVAAQQEAAKAAKPPEVAPTTAPAKTEPYKVDTAVSPDANLADMTSDDFTTKNPTVSLEDRVSAMSAELSRWEASMDEKMAADDADFDAIEKESEQFSKYQNIVGEFRKDLATKAANSLVKTVESNDPVQAASVLGRVTQLGSHKLKTVSDGLARLAESPTASPAMKTLVNAVRGYTEAKQNMEKAAKTGDQVHRDIMGSVNDQGKFGIDGHMGNIGDAIARKDQAGATAALNALKQFSSKQDAKYQPLAKAIAAANKELKATGKHGEYVVQLGKGKPFVIAASNDTNNKVFEGKTSPAINKAVDFLQYRNTHEVSMLKAAVKAGEALVEASFAAPAAPAPAKVEQDMVDAPFENPVPRKTATPVEPTQTEDTRTLDEALTEGITDPVDNRTLDEALAEGITDPVNTQDDSMPWEDIPPPMDESPSMEMDAMDTNGSPPWEDVPVADVQNTERDTEFEPDTEINTDDAPVWEVIPDEAYTDAYNEHNAAEEIPTDLISQPEVNPEVTARLHEQNVTGKHLFGLHRPLSVNLAALGKEIVKGSKEAIEYTKVLRIKIATSAGALLVKKKNGTSLFSRSETPLDHIPEIYRTEIEGYVKNLEEVTALSTKNFSFLNDFVDNSFLRFFDMRDPANPVVSKQMLQAMATVGMKALYSDWQDTNTANKDAQINAMTGFASEAYVSPELRRLLGDGKTLRNNIANNLGAQVLHAMNIKVSNEVDGLFQERLQKAIGEYIVAGFIKAGKLKATQIGRKELLSARFPKEEFEGEDVPVGFLQVTNQSYNRVQRATARTVSNVLSLALGVSKSADFPLSKPHQLKGNPRMKGSTSQASDSVTKGIQAANNTPYVPKKNIIDVYDRLDRKLLGKYLGFKTADEIAAMHVSQQPGAKGKNNSILRAVEQHEDFIAHRNGDWTSPFYFAHTIYKNNRMGLLSKSINPISSKLHRHLYGLQDFSVSVDLSNREQVGLFMFGVSQAFGMKATTALGDTFAKEVYDLNTDTWADTDKGKTIQAAVDALIAGKTSEDYTAEQNAAIFKALELEKEGALSLDGLVNLADAVEAKRSGAKDFTSNLMVEIDGTSNGFISSMLQQFSGDIQEAAVILRRGGIKFKGDTQSGTTDLLSKGELDNYQGIALEASSIIELDTNATDEQKANLNFFVPPFYKVKDGKKEITKDGRTAGKTIMIVAYGAGTTKVAENFQYSTMEAIYTKMADKNIPIEEVVKHLNGMIELGNDLAAKTFVAVNLNPQNKSKSKSNYVPAPLLTAKDLHNGNRTKFLLSPAQQDVINGVSFQLVGMPIAQAIDNVLGSSKESAQWINSAIHVEAAIYAVVYNDLVKQFHQDNKRFPSKVEVDAIKAELAKKGFVPGFKHATSNGADTQIAIEPTDKVFLPETEGGRVKVNFGTPTDVSTLTLKNGEVTERVAASASRQNKLSIEVATDEASVHGALLGAISIDGNVNSAIQHTAPILNVFDAIGSNVLDIAKHTQRVNELFLNFHKNWTHAKAVSEKLDAHAKAFASLTPEQKKAVGAMLLHSRTGLRFLTKDERKAPFNFDAIVNTIQKSLKDVITSKEALVAHIEYVDQYNMPNNGYAAPSAKELPRNNNKPVQLTPDEVKDNAVSTRLALIYNLASSDLRHPAFQRAVAVDLAWLNKVLSEPTDYMGVNTKTRAYEALNRLQRLSDGKPVANTQAAKPVAPAMTAEEATLNKNLDSVQANLDANKEDRYAANLSAIQNKLKTTQIDPKSALGKRIAAMVAELEKRLAPKQEAKPEPVPKQDNTTQQKQIVAKNDPEELVGVEHNTSSDYIMQSNIELIRMGGNPDNIGLTEQQKADLVALGELKVVNGKHVYTGTVKNTKKVIAEVTNDTPVEGTSDTVLIPRNDLIPERKRALAHDLNAVNKLLAKANDPSVLQEIPHTGTPRMIFMDKHHELVSKYAELAQKVLSSHKDSLSEGQVKFLEGYIARKEAYFAIPFPKSVDQTTANRVRTRILRNLNILSKYQTNSTADFRVQLVPLGTTQAEIDAYLEQLTKETDILVGKYQGILHLNDIEMLYSYNDEHSANWELKDFTAAEIEADITQYHDPMVDERGSEYYLSEAEFKEVETALGDVDYALAGRKSDMTREQAIAWLNGKGKEVYPKLRGIEKDSYERLYAKANTEVDMAPIVPEPVAAFQKVDSIDALFKYMETQGIPEHLAPLIPMLKRKLKGSKIPITHKQPAPEDYYSGDMAHLKGKFSKGRVNMEGENITGLTFFSDGVEIAPVRTMVHELVHIVTINAYDNDPKFRKEMDRLLELSRNHSNESYYGNTNGYEFIAESVTNVKFRNHLLSIVDTHAKDTKKTLLDAFVKAVRALFPSGEKVTALDSANIALNILLDIKRNSSGNLQSSSVEVDMNDFADAVRTELTSDSLVSTFDALDTPNLGNKWDSKAHRERLRKLLKDTIAPILKDVGNYVLNQIESNQDTAGMVDLKSKNIYVQHAIGSRLQTRTRMSSQEVLAHEVTHVLLEEGIIRDPKIAEKIRRMHAVVKAKFGKDGYKAFLTPNTKDDPEEIQRAKDKWNHIMEGESYLQEFGTALLTNGAFINLVKNTSISDSYTAPQGILDVMARIFNMFLDGLQSIMRSSNSKTKLPDSMLMIAQGIPQIIQARKSTKFYGLQTAANRKLSSVIMGKVISPYMNYVHNSYNRPERKFSLMGGTVNLTALATLPAHVFNPEYKMVWSTLRGKFRVSRDTAMYKLMRDIQGATAHTKAWAKHLRHEKDHDSSALKIGLATTRLINKSFHNKELKPEDWQMLTEGVIKTELFSLYDSFNNDVGKLHDVLNDDKALDAEIKRLTDSLVQTYGKNGSHYVMQAKGLGYLIATGKAVVPLQMLNPHNIANMLAIPEDSRELVGDIDMATKDIETLVNLSTIQHTSKESRKRTAELVSAEFQADPKENGVMQMMQIQRIFKEDSLETLFDNNPVLMVHGYTKDNFDPAMTLQVGRESDKDIMERHGYYPVGKLPVDKYEPNKEPLVMYASALYEDNKRVSGITTLQSRKAKGSNVFHAAGTGEVNDYDVKTITEQRIAAGQLREAMLRLRNNDSTIDFKANFTVPIMSGSSGVSGFRYMMQERTKKEVLRMDNRANDVLGAMQSSILKKSNRKSMDRTIVEQAKADYDKFFHSSPGRFIRLSDSAINPKHKEIFRMLSSDMKRDIQEVWGEDAMMVQEELLDMIFGFQELSLIDIIDGKLRFSETGLAMRHTVHTLKKMSQLWAEIVKRAKKNIVIFTPAVVAGNFISNLVTSVVFMNIPMREVVRYQRDGYQALRDYTMTEADRNEVLLKLVADPNNMELREDLIRLNVDLRHNPAYELLSEGVFSTIVEDVDEEQKGIFKAVRNLVPAIDDLSKQFKGNLPVSVKTAYEYGMLSRSQNLGKWVYKLTTHSDFIARYAAYQHLKKHNPKMDRETAIQTVMDAFVSYDANHSPEMDWLNKVGLLMFTKFMFRVLRPMVKYIGANPANFVASEMIQAATVNVTDISDTNVGGVITGGRWNDPAKIIEDASALPLFQILPL